MARPVKKNKYPEPKSGARSGRVVHVKPFLSTIALGMARHRDVHLEIQDENTIIIRNGAR